MTIVNFVDVLIDKVDQNDPIHQIDEREFDENLIKFGSFISIVKNKRINHTMLLVFVLEDKLIRECFKQVMEIDNEYVLLQRLLDRFPILCKSKIVKHKLTELARDKSRKTIL